MDWHVVRWNQPIYKYVDQEHANAFSNGSVKIGTLWGYRRMEGAKGDSGENSIPLEFGHTSLHTSNSDHRFILRALGLEVEEDDNIEINFNGSTIHYVGEDFYSFCSSMTDGSSQLEFEKKQAVFEIFDVECFARRLCQLIPILGPAICDRVVYRDRTLARVHQGLLRTNPFVKPHEFEDEKEIRIIWRVNPDTKMGFLPQIPPTQSDPVLQSLITRIR